MPDFVTTGTPVFPEPCPTPAVFTAESCRDAVRADAGEILMHGLGRIIQVDVTLKNICPGKRVAASIILTERNAQGEAEARGVKHVLIPAQEGTGCRDLTLRCIPFSLPEALSGDGQSLCKERSFGVQVLANYVDTDFACCEAGTATL